MIEYFREAPRATFAAAVVIEILLLLDRGTIGAGTRVKKSREGEWRAAQEFHELAGSSRPGSGPPPLSPPNNVASPDDAPIATHQAEQVSAPPPAGGILARFDKPMSNGKILVWTFGLILQPGQVSEIRFQVPPPRLSRVVPLAMSIYL